MKSFLRRPLGFFILFALIVVAGDRLLAMTIGRLIDQSQFRFSRLYRGDAVAEIVAFGDSRCVHSFYAPGLSEALNRKVVNLGYNGFSMEMIECLITDYLEHSSPPKLIILEVTNVFRAPDALINLKPFLTHSPLLTNLYRRERPDDYFYTQLSHLYRLNCELTLRVLYYSARDDQGWILTRPMSAALVEPKGATTAEAEHEDMPYLEKNLAALDRILDLTQKKGVEVRLIVAPYWPDY